jgi:hypothetical protein
MLRVTKLSDNVFSYKKLTSVTLIREDSLFFFNSLLRPASYDVMNVNVFFFATINVLYVKSYT